MDLKVKPIKTSKDKIKQPELAKKDIIPKLGSSIIFCGRSGSGKTTLLHNLLIDDRVYGKNKYFKHILCYLFTYCFTKILIIIYIFHIFI